MRRPYFIVPLCQLQLPSAREFGHSFRKAGHAILGKDTQLVADVVPRRLNGVEVPSDCNAVGTLWTGIYILRLSGDAISQPVTTIFGST